MDPSTSTTPWKKMTKQLTGKRNDSPLHSAARAGQIEVIMNMLKNARTDEELSEMLLKENHNGETALFVAVECGYVDLVKEMIQYYDVEAASVKARNGFDAFHIAAKEGDLEMVKVLMETHPELSMTVDTLNTTSLHTAANQGHVDVVNYLLDIESNLVSIAKSNGKTALHSAARNGHVEIVKALLSVDRTITARTDKKGQTALHMAVKGQNLEVVEELIKADPYRINMPDTKGNTALHVATRKGRDQIVKLLLRYDVTDKNAINRSNETAIDTAEKTGQTEVATFLSEQGVQNARALKPKPTNPARELKQTVSDIKHEVHNQLEHTRQTRRSVRGLAKRVNKMHRDGLNNAINSTTIVAVLIATIAFAAIFNLPGQWFDNPDKLPPSATLGEAKIANNKAFLIFFIFNAIALFLSLAVVVVMTSVVVIEKKAKTQLMAVINKLMWLACALISVAFLALGFVVVGDDEKWMAITVTIIGSTIMATTIGTLCYWVIRHRIEASNLRSQRRGTQSSRSRSWSGSGILSEASEPLDTEYKHMYAI